MLEILHAGRVSHDMTIVVAPGPGPVPESTPAPAVAQAAPAPAPAPAEPDSPPSAALVTPPARRARARWSAADDDAVLAGMTAVPRKTRMQLAAERGFSDGQIDIAIARLRKEGRLPPAVPGGGPGVARPPRNATAAPPPAPSPAAAAPPSSRPAPDAPSPPAPGTLAARRSASGFPSPEAAARYLRHNGRSVADPDAAGRWELDDELLAPADLIAAADALLFARAEV